MKKIAGTSNKGYEDLEKIAKTVQLKEANLEVELIDGYTGEIFAARMIEIEGKTKGSKEESRRALRDQIERAIERFYVNYAARVETACKQAE